MTTYGSHFNNPPVSVGYFPEIEGAPELMHYQYLPVKMNNHAIVMLPDNLEFLRQILDCAMKDFPLELDDHYIYLTVKNSWVEQGRSLNRPGWHVDGYGSNGDINYIWSNNNPTEFSDLEEFLNVPNDDEGSMRAFEEQARNHLVYSFSSDKLLLRLDETTVHRARDLGPPGFRTFIKISFSKHKFNLKGNSHNYLFDYEWEMVDRKSTRNMEFANVG